MPSRRFVIAAAVVAVIALAGVVTFAALRSRSSDESARNTTPTTTAPLTIPVPPLPPAGPTTAPPPAITVPEGTVGTAPPPSTTPPTVTAAPATTTKPTTSTTKPTTPTTKPTTSTTKPTTSTTKPTTPTTKPNKVTRKTVVFTPAGAPKRGDLVLPRQHQATIVVLVHGGDGSTGSRKQMRGWADFYGAHGYPSLAIDYLLVKPNTPAPVYPKPENDVKAAVEYLRNNAGQLGIDADRIVVQGFDDGATLGAQALVGDTPPAAFVGFAGRYDGNRSDQARYYGGPPESPNPQVKERYTEADSITRAAGAGGPVLLYAGEDDDPAVVQSATSFRDALQSAGKDVTLTLVPGAGPSFDQEKSGALTPAGQQAAQQVLDWLQTRFPPS